MKHISPPLNTGFFLKMSHGDLPGFQELAGEFFRDTKHRIPGWAGMMAHGKYAEMREELHRCKGAASLFGLERIVEMLEEVQTPKDLKSRGFDVAAFAAELRVAEQAVAGIGVCD